MAGVEISVLELAWRDFGWQGVQSAAGPSVFICRSLFAESCSRKSSMVGLRPGPFCRCCPSLWRCVCVLLDWPRSCLTIYDSCCLQAFPAHSGFSLSLALHLSQVWLPSAFALQILSVLLLLKRPELTQLHPQMPSHVLVWEPRKRSLLNFWFHSPSYANH